MPENCEVCDDGTPATVTVDRVWHDGTVDTNVRVCKRHSMTDIDGMYKMRSLSVI